MGVAHSFATALLAMLTRPAVRRAWRPPGRVGSFAPRRVVVPLSAEASRLGLSLQEYVAALLLELDGEPPPDPPPDPPPGGAATIGRPAIAPVVSLAAVRRARAMSGGGPARATNHATPR